MKRTLVLSMLLSLGLSSPAIAAKTRTVVLSLKGVDCGECGGRAAAALEKKKGVASAKYDLQKAEIVVKASDAVADADLVATAALPGEKYEVVLGAGQGAYVPFPEMPAGLDAVIVSRSGEDVPSLSQIAAVGKITVFDFYATWCEPCRDIDAHMADVLKEHGDVAYRKLEVADWSSPLAKHFLKKVRGLPFLIVVGSDGKEVGRVLGNHPETLDALIAKGGSK